VVDLGFSFILTKGTAVIYNGALNFKKSNINKMEVIMPINLKGRSLLTLKDYKASEINFLLDSAIEFKKLKNQGIFPLNLKNRNITLIFLKPSCRTRSSFVVAASDEGAHLEIFPKEDIRFGIKESTKDIARVLGRMFDGIAFRGFEHALVQEIAQCAGIPVWNGLCDMYHPTQALADLMTVKEEFGHIEKIKLSYVGDGRNNVANSLIIVALKMGFTLSIIAPRSLWPSKDFIQEVTEKNKFMEGVVKGAVEVTDDIEKGIDKSDAIYSDVWVSMGEESLIAQRIALLKDYKITRKVMDMTHKPETIFLHCMPALHDMNTEMARKYPDILEVDDDVFESHQSRALDQAENRMHTIKAVMVATI
jgi:ornithine carbamoyltransferase